MARHRDAAATRRISRGPIVAVTIVLVLALLTFGWFRLRDDVGAQGAQAAAACVAGTSSVTIAADPDIAAPLTELAKRYSATNPVVRDRCVTVTVTPLASSQVLAGLQKGWDAATSGPQPAGWVAQDSSFTRQLAAKQLSKDPKSVATSPLVLAVPKGAGATVTSSGLSWAELPGVQGSPQGWSRLGQPSWGTFTAALPIGTSGTTLTPQAAQAVAAGVSGAAPTQASLTNPATAHALAALGHGPSPQPETTASALAAIGALTSVPGSPYQAVPATEQQVYAAARTAPGTVSAGVLAGSAPSEDYPFALLAGSAVDDTQTRAAAAFEVYVEGKQAQQALSDAGFRTPGGTLPAGSDAVSFGTPAAALAPTDAASADALTTALTTPVLAPRTTVLLNVSSSMAVSESGGTRLSTTTGALAARLRVLANGSSVGLSTIVRGLGGSAPLTNDVAVAALAANGSQRGALLAALSSLQTRVAVSADSSMVSTYAAAVAAYTTSGTNRVLVITDGPNDNGGTAEAGVLSAARAASDPGRPVRVDVIAIGGEDIGALTALARTTGGTVRTVPSGASDAMRTALTDLLS